MYVGADFHDHHHMVFLGNYASSFRFWDWLCGTDHRYKSWKKRQQQQQQQESFMEKQNVDFGNVQSTVVHAKEE